MKAEKAKTASPGKQEAPDNPVQRMLEEARALGTRLALAREEERKNIAREIHDELGQTLTALKMDLAWLEHQLPAQLTPLREKCRQMAEQIDGTVRMVRRIASELRPGILDTHGLVEAMDAQTQDFQRRMGIRCKLTSPPEPLILTPDLASNLFRIFQELMTNVARHAHASRVEISIRLRSGMLVMEIRDNGKGIALSESGHQSFGLLGICERVHRFGGEVAISTTPKLKGTRVTVKVPLDAVKSDFDAITESGEEQA